MADRDPGAAAAPRTAAGKRLEKWARTLVTNLPVTNPEDVITLVVDTILAIEAEAGAAESGASPAIPDGFEAKLTADLKDAYAAEVARLDHRLLYGESGASPAAEDRGLAALPGLDNPKCQRCGGPHQFDTSIASPLWNRVIRDAGEADYLCASCILVLFVRAETSFEAELYGAAVDIYGAEVPTINVQVGSRPLDRSYGDLQAQLRAALPHGEPARSHSETCRTATSFDDPHTRCQCWCHDEVGEPARTAGDPRVAALEAELLKFGHHVYGCAVYMPADSSCSCGWEERRAALSEASSVREPGGEGES